MTQTTQEEKEKLFTGEHQDEATWEKPFTKEDYSWITSSGFSDDDIEYLDIFEEAPHE